MGARCARAAVLIAALAGPALAETTSVTVFQHRAWQVMSVNFDDGTTSCVAQVSDETDSFSLWADPSRRVRLQFYSQYWDFGEGETADLEVQIDRRTPWTLTNAELYLQSVLFSLPDSRVAVDFVNEVRRGSALYLRNDAGEDVQSYSLAGSSASIGALIDCVNALGRSSNPFN